ncbi:hypothetical protein [Neolewinella sp.]|uniref:hypothetical protein n=1 Tax=Neolewinella sp. TaxID=2993543 RepID=UPI003B52681D
MLPSFGHVPKGTMTSTVNNFDITAYRASGQTVELQPWELMPDVIPRHARFAVARLKSPTTAGVKKKVQLAGHTLDVRLGKRDRKADYGDFSATVLHRLSDQLGTEDPVNRVVVTYYTERFDYARRQFSGRRQTDSFVIARSTDELVK